MNRSTAIQLAKLCATTNGAGYVVEPVPKKEIRHFDFYAKRSVGSYRTSDGSVSLLLLFVDWRGSDNFYVVAADRRGAPLVEIHRLERGDLVWQYNPRKRDERNGMRQEYFQNRFGSLDVRIPLPTTPTAFVEFLDELFLIVAHRRDADALAGDSVQDGVAFPEGRLFERRHLARERSRALVRLAKQHAKATGRSLDCWVCGFSFAGFYGHIGDDFIEAHHTVPVSELDDDAATRIEDLALVCANCHRMLHVRRPWLSLSILTTLIKAPEGRRSRRS